ncbi:hypothetical protein GCM10028784_33970 [Myceligenerans cantabricum]
MSTAMSALAAVVGLRLSELAAATPVPDPTEGGLRPGLETTDITPGLTGFLVTFAVAIACVLLFLSLSRHLRRTRHNAREQGLDVDEGRKKGIEIQPDADPRRHQDARPDGHGAADVPPGGGPA